MSSVNTVCTESVCCDVIKCVEIFHYWPKFLPKPKMMESNMHEGGPYHRNEYTDINANGPTHTDSQMKIEKGLD